MPVAAAVLVTMVRVPAVVEGVEQVVKMMGPTMVQMPQATAVVAGARSVKCRAIMEATAATVLY